MAQKNKEKTSKRKIDVRSIRKRAAEIYRRRMEEGNPGDAESDWLQAEQELMNK